MGQKVNPFLIRLGSFYDWKSRWFDKKRYKDVLAQDYKLRKALMERLKIAGVSQIIIERSINSIKITAFVSRPGIVIGRAGTGLDELKKFIAEILMSGKKSLQQPKLDIRIEPVKEPYLDAYLVAKNVSDQLAKRLPFKRVLAHSASRVMESGGLGVRIVLSGRISGSEIGRREKIQQGTVPLSTLREKIDYASVPSMTKKGYIGVKVWINKP